MGDKFVCIGLVCDEETNDFRLVFFSGGKPFCGRPILDVGYGGEKCGKPDCMEQKYLFYRR